MTDKTQEIIHILEKYGIKGHQAIIEAAALDIQDLFDKPVQLETVTPDNVLKFVKQDWYE